MSIPLSLRPNRPGETLATPDGVELWAVIASVDEATGLLFKLQVLSEFVTLLSISDDPDDVDYTPEIAWAEMQHLHAETDVELVAIWFMHERCSHVVLFKRLTGPLEDREYPGLEVGFDHREHMPSEEDMEEIARQVALQLSKRRDDDPRARNARRN